MITREFDLMLYQEGNLLFINANQYDSGEQWIFTLYEENGVKYTPATGAIVGVKSDGKGIINTGTVDEYGRVVINETQQMTAAAGLATFELLIDNDTHGTANFKVDVEPRPADNADLSDSDLSLIQEAIDSAEVIVEVIGDGDPSEVIGEHVDAWLDAHPEATTTVQDGAITAPKINQSLWDKLLVSEEASGAVASFDDGADDVPVSSLKVALEPIQTGSGDPSPSNVRPIIASNGKNKYNSLGLATYSTNGITVAESNGTLTFNGTATANAYFALTNLGLPLGNYVASINNASANGGVHASFQQTDNTYFGDNALNTENKTVYITNRTIGSMIFYVASGTTLTNFSVKPQLEMGTVATAYQPYQGIMVEQTGRNLLPPFVVNVSWESGNATVVGTGDGAYKFNGTTTGYQQSVIQSDIHLNAGTYTFDVTVEASGTPVPVNVQLRNVSGGVTYATASWATPKQAFTLTEDTTVRMILVVPSAVTLNNVIFKPQIEYGSEATEFEPYTGTSYPYTLGQSVYGGSVDLATGVLTLTKGFKNITASDNIQSIGSSGNGWQVLRSSFDIPPLNRGANYSDGVICDRLKSEVGASSVADDLCFINSSGVLRFNLATVYADKTALFNALGEINVAYPIEPQTIQLTPTQVNTLLGYNNISSTGTVDVIYHADTKLYVDKMTNVDNNIIAPTEEGFTATRNYTVNDLVIVADTLYKVTANIASGSAITPNSNVQQTTLSALIKALS